MAESALPKIKDFLSHWKLLRKLRLQYDEVCKNILIFIIPLDLKTVKHVESTFW